MAYAYNVADWYWDVLDTNHGTHVFSSASGSYVVLADATYVAWLANGNVASTINTQANLYVVINQAALDNLPSLWSVQTVTAAPDMVLSNPPSTLTLAVNNTGSLQVLYLAPANMPTGMPIGVPFYIRNLGPDPITIQNYTGGPVYSNLVQGEQLQVVCLTNNTVNGTFNVTPSVSGGTSGGIPYFINGGAPRSSALLTQYGLVYGGGAGAPPVATAAMTNGQLLVGQTGAAPLPKTISSDVTVAASGAATIANNAVTDAKLRQGVARSVVGVTGNATANTADIQGTASQFLGINAAGTALAFQTMSGDATLSAGAITIANDAVTYAKMQNIATDSLLGRDTAATGDPENILLNATLSMDGAGNLRRAALTGDVTAPAGSNATTVVVKGARVYNSANISLITSTVTTLTFDSERFDTDTIHSTSSTTERLTATTAGKYLIAGNVSYDANTVGIRLTRIRHNGVTVIANEIRQAATTTDVTIVAVSTIYDLAAGDFVELQAYQSSGGNLNVLAAGNYSPEFMMTRLGA